MIFEPIYHDIVNSFGSLWSFKQRGKSLEIITPFATTCHRFVSVFLTKRDDYYIISDGGWVSGGGYENEFDREVDAFNKVVSHFQESFHVKEIKDGKGSTFFYKKTIKEISVPSLVLDVANFINAVISVSNVNFEIERESREMFKHSVNSFLKRNLTSEKLKVNEFLDAKRTVRPNAIITKSRNRLILINYVTGSNDYHFNNSVSKANLIFELARKSNEAIYIEKTVALVDDNSEGFKSGKIGTFLEHLIFNNTSDQVNWSQPHKILEYA